MASHNKMKQASDSRLKKQQALKSQQIPRVLHQIWLQGEKHIPEKFQAYRSSWINAHPGWKMELWDENRILELIRTNYPKCEALYKGYPHMVQRVDVAKYFILNTYGGFYTDMDTECIRPLDDWLLNHTLVLSAAGVHPYGTLPSLKVFVATMGSYITPPFINNGTIGSIPHHPFWHKVINALRKSNHQRLFEPQEKYISNSTGPTFITRLIRQSPLMSDSDCLLAEPEYFDPRTVMSPFDRNSNSELSDKTYAIHHYTLSWMKASRRNLTLQTILRPKEKIG